MVHVVLLMLGPYRVQLLLKRIDLRLQFLLGVVIRTSQRSQRGEPGVPRLSLEIIYSFGHQLWRMPLVVWHRI